MLKNRAAALARLSALITNPVQRTIEERAPLLVLKNGVRLMVEEDFRGRFIVSQDFGLTCREVGNPADLNGLLDIVLAFGAAVDEEQSLTEEAWAEFPSSEYRPFYIDGGL